MRVWSVDWINNPERVIARIENALLQKSKPIETPVGNATFDVTKEEVEEIESNEQAYQVYNGLENTGSMSDEVLCNEDSFMRAAYDTDVFMQAVCAS